MTKLNLKGGLSELLDESTSVDAICSNSSEVMLDCNLIDAHPDQPRKTIDPEFFKELCASIKAQGVKFQIVVRKGSNRRYLLVAGQQRLQACRDLKIKQIPALIKTYDEETAHLVSLIENAVRAPVPVLDEAVALSVMQKKYGWKQVKIAETFGKSERWVSEMLALTDLPPSVTSAARRGCVSHLSQLTQLRLAHKQDAKTVDRFLSKQSNPITFKAAKALYDSVYNSVAVKKLEKSKEEHLPKTVIRERILWAAKKVKANTDLTAKQQVAVDLLTEIESTNLSGQDKIKLIAVSLFPSE